MDTTKNSGTVEFRQAGRNFKEVVKSDAGEGEARVACIKQCVFFSFLINKEEHDFLNFT